MRNLRFSIAGLMGIVLVAAVGLAALRSPTPAWAGATFMVTCAVLGVAIVGAIYRNGRRRAGWLGFCVFGCGYMAIVASSRQGLAPFPTLPTSQLLVLLRPVLGHPDATVLGAQSPRGKSALYHYSQIGHALWALLAGFLGGTLARTFLAFPAERPEEPESGTPETIPRSRRRWIWPALIAWAISPLACAAAAIRSGPDSRTWAGATFFLTCGLLGLAVLVAIFGRGRRRQAAVGAALFGVGYLLLAYARAPYQILPSGQVFAARSLYQPLPTTSLLNGLRRWTITFAGGRAAANARIVAALEQPVSMTFPDPTPLEDVLRYVTMATATPDSPGIPVYLDPIALLEAEQKPTSTVNIDLVGVPLRATLRLCLEQLGLGYRVQDGYLRIIAGREEIPQENFDPRVIAYHSGWGGPESGDLLTDLDDPFLNVGHSLLALLAAGIGAALAPMVADAGRRTPDRTDGPVGDVLPT